MKKLFQKLKDSMVCGEDVVLATIIASSGSTPRGIGARMLVNKNGLIYGTIGGGAVEYKAMQLAEDILREKGSYAKGFKLHRNEIEDLGMICGGDVVVYFQFISKSAADTQAFVESALAMFDKDEDSWIITDITDGTSWKMGIYSDSTGTVGIEIDPDNIKPLLQAYGVQTIIGGRRYYSEPLTKGGKVIVFGGGHIAQELIPLLSHLGFSCTVMDDREEFVSEKLFPMAEKTILCDFKKISESVSITKDDYVVIMTRGHSHDLAVEEQVLRYETAYVGVIGSRAKTAGLNVKLLEADIPQKVIDRVHSPIGTYIKAKTPAEIAISITGELIMVRSERTITMKES